MPEELSIDTLLEGDVPGEIASFTFRYNLDVTIGEIEDVFQDKAEGLPGDFALWALLVVGVERNGVEVPKRSVPFRLVQEAVLGHPAFPA